MSIPTLIYCAAGAPRMAQIALEAGFRYGCRLPGTVYGPLYFADQDWKKPNRAAYMAALARHRPHMATVLDWEREDQLGEVLGWAEEAAQHVERVLIVPKVIGQVHRIPRRVGGREVVLAYSVPTRYGGTQVPAWEFSGRPIHLLGGSPRKQIRIWHYLSVSAEVVSTDGNYAHKLATQFCRVWSNGTARYADNRWQPQLKDMDGREWGQDAPYEAFRRSCINIVAAWQALGGKDVYSAVA